MKIKYPALLVATLVHFMLGGLWYSPLLFGNKFIQVIGWSPAKLAEIGNQSHTKEYILAFASSAVLVFILAHFIQYTKATTAMAGVQTAFWAWLGFIATTSIATVLFEQRPLGLYLINAGYQLVGCSLAGAILAIWRTREATETAAQAA
ncbi:MAG: DUF1761 domain-containing protein [Pyrinomonadaceae bacterium]